MEGLSQNKDDFTTNVSPPPYTPKAEVAMPHKPHPQLQPPQPGFVPNVTQSCSQVTVIPALKLGSDSQMVHCTYCGVREMTHIKYKPNSMTHVIALILCALCLPCVCIPYICESCQSTHHYCSNCKAYLGEYRS
nr:lipopolysaccharide-induced tumor necrosis factor-alpha factor homolog [Onthophagus taurus]